MAETSKAGKVLAVAGIAAGAGILVYLAVRAFGGGGQAGEGNIFNINVGTGGVGGTRTPSGTQQNPLQKLLQQLGGGKKSGGGSGGGTSGGGTGGGGATGGTKPPSRTGGTQTGGTQTGGGGIPIGEEVGGYENIEVQDESYYSGFDVINIQDESYYSDYDFVDIQDESYYSDYDFVEIGEAG